MKQEAATAKVKNASSLSPMDATAKQAKAKSGRRAKPEDAGNKEEASVEFLVGALLYSLFASNRRESVRDLMTQDE